MWERLLILLLLSFAAVRRVSSSSVSFGPKLVDMTHTFDNRTFTMSSFKPIHIIPKINGTQPGGYWELTEGLAADTTHGGTHIDAPCHHAENRWCITDIPLDRLVSRPAAVVDIRTAIGNDPSVRLQTEHLIDWEFEHGRIPDGYVLLICTGWSRFYPDKLAYVGSTVDDKRSLLKYPSIDKTAASWIANNRNIVGIGIDAFSIDSSSELGRPAHFAFSDKNIHIMENLNNVCLLPALGAIVNAMPIKLKNAGGSPLSIFAQLPFEMYSK